MELAFGRRIGDFGELSAAEQALLSAVARGEMLELADQRMETPTDRGVIRSSLVRFLVLGGDEKNPVHELGVQIRGAVLNGALNLSACTVVRPLKLEKCWVNGEVVLDNATAPTLNFQGSRLSAFSGDGANILGDLFVCTNFRSDGPIRVVGARIGGDFDGTDSEFRGGDERNPKEAVTLDSTSIGGRLHLYNSVFDGAIRLNSADIKGDADFANVHIVGRPIKDLDPTLPSETRHALVMHRAQIGGRLFLTQLSKVDGQIRLIYAHCAVLVDDEAVLDRLGCSDLLLDGFTYDRIYTSSPTASDMRERWLSQPTGASVGRFRPQPWVQLAKVLREMGEEETAISISIAREDRRRSCGDAPRPVKVVHYLYGVFNGYGYRPHRVLNFFFAIFAAGALVYGAAKERNGIVQVDSSKAAASFNPWLYSLDNTVPFVNFGQSKEWRTNTLDSKTGPSGKVVVADAMWGLDAGAIAYAMAFLQTLFGWLGGISLVAFLNRLLKRE